MHSETRQFGELAIGELFVYRDQLYRKESENSAELLRWIDGEEVTEYVSHRFFPELVVTLGDEQSGE